jgi:hypothetical protein
MKGHATSSYKVPREKKRMGTKNIGESKKRKKKNEAINYVRLEIPRI